MSVPRRERDARRTAAQRASEEYYLRRLMEEAPGGRVTSSDVAHIKKNHNRHLNERRPAEAMGMNRGGPQISFGPRVIPTPRSQRKE